MAEALKTYACTCLNVRVHVQHTADERAALEDIANVLECTLDSSAIQVELSALVEVVPGSSIERNISVVRCLLCKHSVLYFLTAATQAQRQMPAPFTTAYLSAEARDPPDVAASQVRPEYSQPFGVLLLSAFADVTRPRQSAYTPREMQQKVAEFMQRQEAAKNERVREFIRAQDEELERVHRRTTDECSVLAEIISRAHPKAQTAQARAGHAGSSGLAAMLRGGVGAARSGQPRGAHAGRPVDIAEEPHVQAGLGHPVRSAEPPSRQSDEDYSDGEHEEDRFDSHAAPRTGSNLSQMLAGSMPIQIPRFGSSSLAGAHSLSRQEYQQRADEVEKSRRREQILRGLPKTFVPPHELMDQLHANDADLLIGSKPRDSYGLGRRHAPG
ncbi:hypothetical protein GGI25_004380 [Coemansia spiralis]|uniref:Uncharacterized protein n=2 Tax=Coemansia TaxID=4863 RepID=A0A9W8G4X1_9FUNG|nr:hypothetical protein BX070DRAFT_252030 [Coemansia spiralis]KAJ1995332.1 hypothetical protein EDC05_000884 [Coemansia umbellata]KAJ2624841.1 hypothetical protein GGI26_001257 [Coemansia sp. RSA 1358]KAJ2674359.1 hypothetical protein GGI25_004380 [Coemansia spiralis]